MTEVVSFLPEDEFIAANRGPIEAVFHQLGEDFPESQISFQGKLYTPAEALQIDVQNELTPSARQWLWQKAHGFQHGYDRGVDGKVFIGEDANAKYMGLLKEISYGNYNFVEGGAYQGDTCGKNILIPCGFPHINAGRLHSALNGNYESLWGTADLIMITGQRRRWNDNANEATGDIVVSRTLDFSGLSPDTNARARALQTLEQHSKFAREQSEKSNNGSWQQQYPTEAEMARLALEVALVQADDIFDWREYPVKAWIDLTSEPIAYRGEMLPARTIKAWQYMLNNSCSAWVINSKALPRMSPDGTPSEPRPNGESAAGETYDLLAEKLAESESIIATGAPHIRLGIDTAVSLLKTSGSRVNVLHLSASSWEEHEPAITGIASIVSTNKADKRLRAVVADKNPDSPELMAFGG